MSDDRLRIPQDAEYFHAIGLAAVAFSRLEWNAVWCCERLQSGYIDTIESHRKTAGKIAENMVALFNRISNTQLRVKVEPFAIEFSAVVQERNGLLHGKPGTDSNGDQRLFRHDFVWTLDRVNEFSNRCVRADEPLNALLYNELQQGCNIALNPP